MTFLLPFAQFRYLKTDVFQLLLVTFYKVFCLIENFCILCYDSFKGITSYQS